MPLFVFIIFGMIQLGLLHQGRLLAKYAAFKAVRAGAINRAKKDVMTNAATAVLLPLLARTAPLRSGSADGPQPQYGVYPVRSGGEFRTAYTQVANSLKGPYDRDMVKIDICTPNNNNGKGKDFDDFRSNGSDWKEFDNTKLAIQVTFFMPMYIPYANGMIWWAARGEDSDSVRAETMRKVRLKSTGGPKSDKREAPGGTWTLRELDSEAKKGNYIMPIRASYAMRMQSNFADDVTFQDPNPCQVNWKKK